MNARGYRHDSSAGVTSSTTHVKRGDVRRARVATLSGLGREYFDALPGGPLVVFTALGNCHDATCLEGMPYLIVVQQPDELLLGKGYDNPAGHQVPLHAVTSLTFAPFVANKALDSRAEARRAAGLSSARWLGRGSVASFALL